MTPETVAHPQGALSFRPEELVGPGVPGEGIADPLDVHPREGHSALLLFDLPHFAPVVRLALPGLVLLEAGSVGGLHRLDAPADDLVAALVKGILAEMREAIGLERSRCR